MSIRRFRVKVVTLNGSLPVVTVQPGIPMDITDHSGGSVRWESV